MPPKAHFPHSRALSLLFMALALLLLPSLPASGAAQQADPTAVAGSAVAVPLISHSDAQGLTFELRTPPLTLDRDGAIAVPGLLPGAGAPGTPALPFYSTYIALPPQATVSVTVTAGEQTTYRAADVRPVPLVQLRGQEPGSADLFTVTADTLQETEPLYGKDPAVYSQDALYPDRSYQLSAPQIARDLRLVRLDLYPVRYIPGQQVLTQAQSLKVKLLFAGAELNEPRKGGEQSRTLQAWHGRVLNPPPSSWLLEPQAAIAKDQSAAQVSLPVGVPAFKIEIIEDGIYELTGTELAAAGMDLAAVDVTTLQMMHRGADVAFQFIDVGGKSGFEPQDKIRFYGWAFDGSRYEDSYVDRNYFWLWAGGKGTAVPTIPNGPGSDYTAVTSFPASVTSWPHNTWFSAWGVPWDESPNEATAWHWQRISGIPQNEPTSRSFVIDVLDPVPGAAADRTLTVEMTSRLSTTGLASTYRHNYTATARLNDQPADGTVTWQNQGNANLVGAVSGDQLLSPNEPGYPSNTVELTINGTIANASPQLKLNMYLTRITVDYVRQLRAVADQLQFGLPKAGKYEFQISGFAENGSAKTIVWDVTNRLKPKAIQLGAGDISGSTDGYTYAVRLNQGANGRVLATTTANVRSVENLSKYVSPSLTPPSGEGQWLAIAHSSLLPAAQDLAAYRGQKGLSAWVVDIQDIVNQVGYGYHTPVAIRTYLQKALATWKEAPEYVALFGDATVNPRYLPCAAEDCPAGWDPNKPNLVATDLLFIDRFQGLVPIDYSMSLLVGDDDLSDVALGRIPAQNLDEARAMVSKIITYEANLAQPTAARDHFLFVADNPDGGGNFCAENADMVNYLPTEIQSTQLCLATDEAAETDALRTEMFRQINDVGLTIMNYRGHGAIDSWAGPTRILNAASDQPAWQNIGRPVLLISADCLDAYFAMPYVDGLGETFVRLGGNRGSAAHWASTGLGYTFEHTPLHRGFYEAIFTKGQTAVGDAVNYSKAGYLQAGYDVSEAYAFTLLGDPAMTSYPAAAPPPPPEYIHSSSIPVVLKP